MGVGISGSVYQSFETTGASNSSAKLEAIRLPRDLSGKSFLDIGCNEGFFCIEAKRRGADRVVGIDRNPEFIRRAKERAPEIEFHAQSWDELPEGKFDIIIMLSALHYERKPRDLLDRIHSRLADGGLLILEVGVAREPGMTRVWTQRKSTVFHPTWEMLRNRYLERFAFRPVGRSVDQPGDPVPRWVIHCEHKKPTVLVISGRSSYGKTTLARLVGQSRYPVIEVDAVLRRLLDSATRFDTPLLEVIKEFSDTGVRSFSQIMEGIVDAGLSEEFANLLYDHIPLDDTLVVLEGYGLREDVLAHLIAKLEGEAIVWTCQRLDPPTAREQLAREAPEEIERLRSKLSRSVKRSTVAELEAQVENTRKDSATAVDRNQLSAALAERDRLRDQLERLRSRRSVRLSLKFASWGKPLINLSRRLRNRR